MAAGDKFIVPTIISKAAPTGAATALSTASNIVECPGFIIQAAAANTGTIYVGGSAMGTSTNGVALTARERIEFFPYKRDRELSNWYDLAQFYVRASAGTQRVNVMVLDNKA